MRRVIRKRIRRTGDGVDLAVDFNADVAINVGHSDARMVTGEDEKDREDPAEPTDANDAEGKEP